jgi:HEAT repeat-containing protein 6
MASTSSGTGGARPWRTALLTLRDESVASPSPFALLALLRRVLLSPASPSLAASAAALSPHEVGLLARSLYGASHASALLDLTSCGMSHVQVASDVAFLAETAVAVASCPDADGALRGVCHLVRLFPSAWSRVTSHST